MPIFQKYHYSGPIYYNGRKQTSDSVIYTRARSLDEARNNIIYRLANGDKRYIPFYDLDDSKLKIVKRDATEVHPSELKPIKLVHYCDICGYELNDQGECPVCDFGEYDLLDNI